MPGQYIDKPNPPPLPSHLPDQTLDLIAKPPKKPLDKNVAQSLKDFQQAACYLAACKSSHPAQPYNRHRLATDPTKQ